MTNELVRVSTCGTVSKETMCELLHKITGLKLKGPVTLVLDHARYQRCAVVLDLAERLEIRLLFLPSYSPNLNLIGRLWKLVKRDVLYGRHSSTFDEVLITAIDGCLDKIPTDHRESLKTLMTHNFPTFNTTSFLAE